MRVDPSGELVNGPVGHKTSADASDGMTVWLERDGEPGGNDAIILERLAISVRIRHARGLRDIDGRRHMGLLLDAGVSGEERQLAAASLNLSPTGTYRVVAAPLFAIWTEHPAAPEDVVPTRFGPMHALVVPVDTATLKAGPCGSGRGPETSEVLSETLGPRRASDAPSAIRRLGCPPGPEGRPGCRSRCRGRVHAAAATDSPPY